MLAAQLLTRILGVGALVVLARLLTPGDFGLMALGVAIAVAIELLTSFSFDLALIQRPEAQREHYDAAWTLRLLQFTVTAVLLLASAHTLSGFYDDPRLTGILHLLAVGSLCSGIQNIGIVAFRKELDLRREFIFQVISNTVMAVTAIGVAVWFKNHWALPAGYVARRAAELVLSYTMHPYRPRLCLSGARPLLHFSRWMVLKDFFIFLNNRADDFIVGKFTGMSVLGGYSMAYDLANTPTSELVFPVSRAMFPGYAKVAGEPERLRRYFLNAHGLSALLVTPLSLGVVCCAPWLVIVVLGVTWTHIVPLVQVFGWLTLFRGLTASAGALYMGVGRPDITAKIAGARMVVLLPGLFVAVHVAGAMGAAVIQLVLTALFACLNVVIVHHLIQAAWAPLLRTLWRPVMAGLVMAAALTAVPSSWTSTLHPLLTLVLLIGTGAIVYTAVLAVLAARSGDPQDPERLLSERFRAWAARRWKPIDEN